MKVLENLEVCRDCYLAIAGYTSEDGDIDPSCVEAVNNYCEEGQHLVPAENDGDTGFYKTPCDICGDYLAGERYNAAVLG